MQKANIDLKENSTTNLWTSSLLNLYLTKENRNIVPTLATRICFLCSSHCFKFTWDISIYLSGDFIWKIPASLKKWAYVQPKLSSSDGVSCTVVIPFDGATAFQVTQISNSCRFPVTCSLLFSCYWSTQRRLSVHPPLDNIQKLQHN